MGWVGGICNLQFAIFNPHRQNASATKQNVIATKPIAAAPSSRASECLSMPILLVCVIWVWSGFERRLDEREGGAGGFVRPSAASPSHLQPTFEPVQQAGTAHGAGPPAAAPAGRQNGRCGTAAQVVGRSHQHHGAVGAGAPGQPQPGRQRGTADDRRQTQVEGHHREPRVDQHLGRRQRVGQRAGAQPEQSLEIDPRLGGRLRIQLLTLVYERRRLAGTVTWIAARPIVSLPV